MFRKKLLFMACIPRPNAPKVLIGETFLSQFFFLCFFKVHSPLPLSGNYVSHIQGSSHSECQMRKKQCYLLDVDFNECASDSLVLVRLLPCHLFYQLIWNSFIPQSQHTVYWAQGCMYFKEEDFNLKTLFFIFYLIILPLWCQSLFFVLLTKICSSSLNRFPWRMTTWAQGGLTL